MVRFSCRPSFWLAASHFLAVSTYSGGKEGEGEEGERGRKGEKEGRGGAERERGGGEGEGGKDGREREREEGEGERYLVSPLTRTLIPS